MPDRSRFPAPLHRREGRLAVAITVAVWFISSVLFIVPMLVAGQPLTLHMIYSLIAIALGGSLVALALMVVIWRVFDSERTGKIAIAALAVLAAAVALTLFDLATAEIFISFQPGNQLSSARLFRATNNFAVFIPHFALLGAIYALLAHHRRAVKRERMLAETASLAQQARLSALRYQLNPHFLFNTLNSISSLVVTGRNRDAEEMLTRLSEFLRTTLVASPDQPQTLEGELETIAAYLGIERIRFGERLGLDLDCPAPLRDVHIPSFLLQPLVENAIKHGLSPTSAAVTIGIAVRSTGTDVEVTVRNDMADEVSGESGAGVGLRNVRDRLQAMYGDRASLTTGRSGDEYRVTVRLPSERGPMASCAY
jgi:hypothetical protein